MTILLRVFLRKLWASPCKFYYGMKSPDKFSCHKNHGSTNEKPLIKIFTKLSSNRCLCLLGCPILILGL
ncbi:hypothetical protein LEP1GSC190_04460 [Leptospira mayottensis 200901116]|nr:hypothetical protein LEP1GSC190_04460 [Leptospira mayottensis 200901116]TGN08681.1 hypothetical protein EHR03_09175 [Leptospira mayottensis]